MLPMILDKNFQPVGDPVKCSFLQYTEEYNGAGSLELQLPLDETALMYMRQGAFLLIDKETAGSIDYFHPQVDQNGKATLTFKGFMSNGLLSRRCIPKSIDYYGTAADFVWELVGSNCVSPTESSRALPITLGTNSSTYTEREQRQATGGSVEEKIEAILSPQELGYEVVPMIGSNGNSVTGFEFNILQGADRTIGNTDGNAPVVFSTDLKNVLTGEYTYNSSNYRNVGIVAGEGEGTDRTIVLAGETTSEGLDRYESYIDARDLQSTDEEGNTMTDVEYKEALRIRGLERLEECPLEEVYEATIRVDERYTYKQDYFKGDKVSIRDNVLGVELDARITAVQVSISGGKTTYDLTFGSPKMRISKLLKRNGVI